MGATKGSHLAQILDAYLHALEAGDPPDREALLARHPDRVAVSREVQDVHRLVADDPRVVPWRDVAHLERAELDLLAVVHAHPEPAREAHLAVVDEA